MSRIRDNDVEVESAEASASVPRRNRAVTVLFRDGESAARAFWWIFKLGYGRDDVNLLMSDETPNRYLPDDMDDSDWRDKVMTDAGGRPAARGKIGSMLVAIAALGTSVALPGIGLVVAGPMAAALAGAASLTDALIGSGIPEERAREYERGIGEGGLLISVNFRTDEDADNFEREILRTQSRPRKPSADAEEDENRVYSVNSESKDSLRSLLEKRKILNLSRDLPKRRAGYEVTSLYANSWFEDRKHKPLRPPFGLLLGEEYKFLFAIEREARQQGAASRPFEEPKRLQRSPESRVLLEVCSALLEGGAPGRGGYARREVVYRRGAGFAPESFDLKPTRTGTSFVTVRLIKETETVYREVVEVEVIAASPTEFAEAVKINTVCEDERFSRTNAPRR